MRPNNHSCRPRHIPLQCAWKLPGDNADSGHSLSAERCHRTSLTVQGPKRFPNGTTNSEEKYWEAPTHHFDRTHTHTWPRRDNTTRVPEPGERGYKHRYTLSRRPRSCARRPRGLHSLLPRGEGD